MTELKPCPFCGGKAIYDTNGTAYCAICVQCGARCALTYFSGKKGKDIIAGRWNRRDG